MQRLYHICLSQVIGKRNEWNEKGKKKKIRKRMSRSKNKLIRLK